MENPRCWWYLPRKMGIFHGYVSLLECIALTLDIQTPAEYVFEPPNISWGSGFGGSKHRISPGYWRIWGCQGNISPFQATFPTMKGNHLKGHFRCAKFHGFQLEATSKKVQCPKVMGISLNQTRNIQTPSQEVWMDVYLESLVYHFFRQLWLVLGVKLMEINSNWFSR